MNSEKLKERESRRHFSFFLKECGLTVLFLVSGIAAAENGMMATSKTFFLLTIVMFVITCYTGMMWDREECGLDKD